MIIWTDGWIHRLTDREVDAMWDGLMHVGMGEDGLRDGQTVINSKLASLRVSCVVSYVTKKFKTIPMKPANETKQSPGHWSRTVVEPWLAKTLKKRVRILMCIM